MMVIGKINTVFMKHSRILFGAISVVIIVSFLGFLTPGFTSMFGGGGDGKYGTAFGEKVSFSAVRDQARKNQIAYDLAYGGILPAGQLADMAGQNAFMEICRQAAAKERGIYVGDAQVTDFIASQPRFRDKGVFSSAKYKEYLKTLAANNVSGDDVYDAVRGFLTSRQLNQELMDSVVVTPGELALFKERFRNRYKFLRAEFNPADYLGQAKVPDAEIQKYFESARDKFMIPGSFQVVLAELPYDGAAVKAAVAKTKSTPKDAALHLGKLFAYEAYETLTEMAAKDRRAAFERLAKSHGFRLSVSDRVSADAAKIGKVESAELVRMLSQVYANVPISDAVAAGNAVYVGFVLNPTNARRAEFKEVQGKVGAEVRSIAAGKLATSAAAGFADKLRKMNVKDRAALVQNNKTPAFQSLEPFSLMSLQPGQPGAEIASSLDELKAGDVKMVPGVRGATLYYLEGMLPADGKDKQSDEELAALYRRYKSSAVLAAFDNYLNSRCAQYVRDKE